MNTEQKMQELENEIFELKVRASKIGYKNAVPSLPKLRKHLKNHESVIGGFIKRLNNWKRELYLIENPGGYPVHKKQDKMTSQTAVLTEELAELAKKYNN